MEDAFLHTLTHQTEMYDYPRLGCAEYVACRLVGPHPDLRRTAAPDAFLRARHTAFRDGRRNTRGGRGREKRPMFVPLLNMASRVAFVCFDEWCKGCVKLPGFPRNAPSARNQQVHQPELNRGSEMISASINRRRLTGQINIK